VAYSKEKYEEYKARLKKRYAEDAEYREEIKRKRREYFAANKDKILAQTQKPEARARNRKWQKDWCDKRRAYVRARSRKHYHKSGAACLDRHRKRSRGTKIKCVEYLGGKCLLCGYSEHLSALQFHHVDPELKTLTISSKISNGWSFGRLEDELSKCVLLCANCHSEVTTEHSWRKRQEKIKKQEATRSSIGAA